MAVLGIAFDPESIRSPIWTSKLSAGQSDPPPPVRRTDENATYQLLGTVLWRRANVTMLSVGPVSKYRRPSAGRIDAKCSDGTAGGEHGHGGHSPRGRGSLTKIPLEYAHGRSSALRSLGTRELRAARMEALQSQVQNARPLASIAVGRSENTLRSHNCHIAALPSRRRPDYKTVYITWHVCPCKLLC